MDKLKELLKSQGININHNALMAKVRKAGYDPTNLTEEQAGEIATLIQKEQQALIPAVPSAVGIVSDYDAVLRESVGKVDELKAVYTRVVDKVTDAKANEIATLIASIPDLTYEKVTRMLEQSPDIDSFRQSPEALETELLRAFGL